MANKTFKIGERCIGGVITVETTAKTITVINKEWDSTNGHRRGVSQKNAEELDRMVFDIYDEQAYRKMDVYLNKLTSSYWSGEILDWILSKSKLDKTFWW